jgi:MFS family permease
METIQPTNTLEYYIGYITVLGIGYVSIMLLTNFLKNRNEEQNKQNITMDYYGAKGSQVVLDVLTEEQRSLRWRFLLVSTAIKAATWVKAPYLFALYNRVHGFTRSQIGILYAIDNVTSLFLGPIIGSLCDTYGRKKFCVLYCFLIMAHISLRITGSQYLAYFAQILTGICSVLIDTAFESWVNYQSNSLFDDTENGKKEKNSFLRELFTKQVNIDCLTSIALTGVATYLYIKYGIFYPFYCCILFALIAAFLIMFLWEENVIIPGETKRNFIKGIGESWEHIRKKGSLLCLGSIESLFKIALVLFLFIWTPLLEETVGARIHPGAIFACFMLARLMGSETFTVHIINTGIQNTTCQLICNINICKHNRYPFILFFLLLP